MYRSKVKVVVKAVEYQLATTDNNKPNNNNKNPN